VANRFIFALQQHFEPLRSFPNSGAPRNHIRPGLRVVFHQRYAIYYRPLPDIVVILRIVHGARDIAKLIERGEFTDI
jgi:toxin ParE1/3/4